MQQFIRAALTLLIVCGISSSCLASLDILIQHPDHWQVVKETRDYLIVEVVEDITFDADGKDGMYKVNYQAGQRRIFLKGRKYRSILKSTGDYKVQQKIEVEVQSEEPDAEG